MLNEKTPRPMPGGLMNGLTLFRRTDLGQSQV